MSKTNGVGGRSCRESPKGKEPRSRFMARKNRAKMGDGGAKTSPSARAPLLGALNPTAFVQNR